MFLWFSYGFPMVFPLKPPFSYGKAQFLHTLEPPVKHRRKFDCAWNGSWAFLAPCSATALSSARTTSLKSTRRSTSGGCCHSSTSAIIRYLNIIYICVCIGIYIYREQHNAQFLYACYIYIYIYMDIMMYI